MPLLHLLAGPNGSGKTTFYEQVLAPATGLPFINADVIARERWPKAKKDWSYEAAKIAAQRRDEMILAGRSFIAETVFSHPSKLDLIRTAKRSGFLVVAHIILVPLPLSIRRVEARVRHGGHDVPVEKQNERFTRLWPLVAEALQLANEGFAYDNSSAKEPFRLAAKFENGKLIGKAAWPDWSDLGKLFDREG
ncbi:ATPase [Stagnimonas aquatica]|uniref:ATPase n=1 Tax=Stagnimonas aquatica TaxID=2689987 RepID=A0A3N0V0X7_9GAMM|nr:AAA family ATPase [Stagnimonas aquatica]ROH86410.1 ATPase [Stagnimonas aquatica]